MKTLKKLTALVLVIAALTACLVGCNKSPLADYEIDESTEAKDVYYVAMAVKNHGIIIVKLDAVSAPITVKNFVKLVREGFYDGLTFHRVKEGFMIQGGDPEGTGMGGSPNKIKGEFASNGVANPISHTTGVVSMARRGNDMNSASSQFFIMHQTATHLDGDYAAFGKVWRGIETVNQIAKVPTDGSDKPLTDVVIKTMSFVEIPQ